MRTLFGRLRFWCVLCVALTTYASLCAPLVSAAPDSMTATMASPLSTALTPVDALITPLSLDNAAYQSLKARADVRINGFSLDATRKVDLELKRIEVFTPGARIVTVTAGGEVHLPMPDMLLLSGTVVGHADSSVFLSLSPHGTRGWVAFDGDRFVISSGPGRDRTKPVIYDYNAVAPNQINWADGWTCGVDNLKMPAGVIPVQRGAEGTSASASAGGGAAVFDAQVAVETDFEFTNNLFGGNTDAATAYVATIFAAASEIYVRDVGTRLSVNFLRLWETSNDPWTITPNQGTSAQLNQFRSYWNANESDVFRHLTHFLSGRSLGGGVAWLDAACVTGLNYGLSANLRGFFPVPVQDHHSSNWDIMVVTHEMGHNFGSVHTHNMSPVVDGCGNGDCSSASSGTIMSYCHLCSPGMSNLSLRFHDRVISEQILPFLTNQISCDIGVGPATILAQPTDTTACAGGIVRMTVGAGGTSPRILQWRKDGADLPGVTGGVLQMDPVSALDAGAYDVVVTNAEGTTTSDEGLVQITDCGPPDAFASGCRALSVAATETNLSAPVAFRVSSPQIPCMSGYLGLDGILVDEPVFHPASEWGDAVVLGPEIVPETQYEVQMDYGSPLDSRLTLPTTVTTGPWGDVAGENVGGVWGAPDGVLAIGDALAGIACFVHAPGAPRQELCDIHPAAPNGSVEIIDVLQMIAGFQGLPYPFPPPGCP